MRSPSQATPIRALNTAWVANKTPARRGPSRFMAANKAVSPIKIPTSPLSAITAHASGVNVRQPPLTASTAHSIKATIDMRQRVKAKAPKWRAGMTEVTLPTAQQPAAPRANKS